MHFKLKALTLAVALPLVASQANAAPKFLGDARAIAMGGTGVASAVATSASFFNPALVAAKQDDSRDGFGLMLPTIHVLAADEEEVVKKIEKYQDDDLFEQLERNVDTLNSAADDQAKILAAQSLLATATQINDDLVDLDGDAVKFELGLGSSIVIPGQTFGVSVFTNATLKGTTTIDYNDADLYEFYISEAQKIANDQDDAANTLPDPIKDNLESEGYVVAAAKMEVGITFAREFEIADRAYAIGISPKYQITSGAL